MVDSFVFSGIGFVTGDFEVSNKEIYKHVKSGYLKGFNADRIESTEEYQQLKAKNTDLNPFSYMVENVMGFKTRFHVVPFPPVGPQYKNADNSLDLCVKAISIAIEKSGISGNNIDAWFCGTATPHQQAPGICEFAKAYFTDIDNLTPTHSLTSACVGFNINLESAVSFLKNNPEANNVIVAHAEVMSKLLIEENDFVPFSTFGDSAAAVVLSRMKTEEPQGVLAIYNGEDTRMLDFLGANKKGNLYMNPRMVKFRAVPNIANTSKLLMKLCNWTNEDLACFVPHQTGNAIVWSVAKELRMPKEKVFQEIQLKYGNLSGASVPACLSLLQDSHRLNPNDKIITAVAGLGGEFGGFAYLVPEKLPVFEKHLELAGKTILITGATGGLGKEIAKLAASKGADLILHYNSNTELANKLKNEILSEFQVKVSLAQANFSIQNELELFCKHILANFKPINYLINTHAITGKLGKATNVSIEEFNSVIGSNYLSIKYISNFLKEHITECILITGSVGEDAQFPGSASYVASKRALRGFARNFASEIYSQGLRCIYYLPGIIDSGMVGKLDNEQVLSSIMAVDQKKLIPVDKIAERMLKSMYRPKVANVRMSYETNLKVIKDGYLKF